MSVKSRPQFVYSLPLVTLLLTGGIVHADEREGFRGAPFFLVPTLATTGSSGALNVPDGRTLPDGVVTLGMNNSMPPEFYPLLRGETYQFGIGLFRYLELTGRLANYPVNDRGDLGVRDLSANVKLSLPKIFRYQPDIAIGINDLGGGAPTFESKYIAVSESFGPLRLNLGAARGKPYLNGVFGSAELALWNTGGSVLVEHNADAVHLGVRYGSAPIRMLGNARLVANAQRSFGANAPDGRKFDRTSVGVNLLIPFGENARKIRRVALEDEPIWTPPAGYAMAVAPSVSGANAANGADHPVLVQRSLSQPSPLESIRSELIKAGLERVRVGLRDSELLVEYENHRYNQNEVDAIGIALGVGVMLAPQGVATVSVITKKAGLGLYKTSVGQARYHQFLRDGDPYDVKSAMTLQYRSGSMKDVEWFTPAEGPRGYSRLRLDPQLIKFVGTELGVFDYSLAVNAQAIVPLWKGAELTTSLIASVHESENVAHGFFGYAKQRNGLKSAIVSQAVWLTDGIINVTSAGKFLYDGTGVQNETTWFMPYRDDQIRLQYSRMHTSDIFRKWVFEAGSASYLWNYAPLGATIEVAYNRYVGQDSGPSVHFGRWFGDIQAQAYLRKSNIETRVGFSLAFPLTPRQGMRPGLTHVEGAGSFPFKLETKRARAGECNCITAGVVEEMSMVYSARNNLFNFGRMGKEYVASQLPRMREAALVFAPVAR